jgi:hypothetical protein
MRIPAVFLNLCAKIHFPRHLARPPLVVSFSSLSLHINNFDVSIYYVLLECAPLSLSRLANNAIIIFSSSEKKEGKKHKREK